MADGQASAARSPRGPVSSQARAGISDVPVFDTELQAELAEIRRQAMASEAAFAVETIFGLYAAWRNYEDTRWFGKYQQSVYRTNAAMAEIQAKDAIRRGEAAAQRRGEQVAQIAGEQRVAAATQGIRVGVGSSGEAQAEAVRVGMMDALEIENNAYKEAMGIRMEASRQLMAGMGRRVAAEARAAETLTTRLVGVAGGLVDRYQGSSGTGRVVRRRV